MKFLKREDTVDDAKLNSASQQKMASLVKGLPDEDLSMAWRSSLNAKLMAAQEAKAKKKMARRYYAWGSSLSLGVAASIFGAMIMSAPAPKSPTQVADSNSFGSELVKVHQESMVLASVSGTGAAARETSFVDDSSEYQDDLL